MLPSASSSPCRHSAFIDCKFLGRTTTASIYTCATYQGWRLEIRSGSSNRRHVPIAGPLFAQGESNMSNASRLTGVAIAAAAATLFVAGCANMGSGTQTADSGAVKVKCYGANACKGQAECKTGMNNCKGQ